MNVTATERPEAAAVARLVRTLGVGEALRRSLVREAEERAFLVWLRGFHATSVANRRF